MIRSLPLFLLAGLVLEITSIIWVGRALGVLPTLLLLLAGAILGTSLMKSAGTSVVAALRSPVRTAAPLGGVGEKALGRAVAGLLFLIPGFFSDFFGLLLLLPPVRAWLRSKIKVQTFSASTPPAQRFDRVIEAEAVEISGEIDAPGQGRDSRT